MVKTHTAASDGSREILGIISVLIQSFVEMNVENKKTKFNDLERLNIVL